VSRYYSITLTPPGSNTPVRTWESHPGGVFNPRALDIEFDCQVASFATATQIFTVTIRGVALQDISQAQQFTGMRFEMKGGMQAGLPLANPKQANTLVVGQVFQSFGNWEGVDMRLDLVIAPSVFTLDNPGNIVLDWKAGQTLSQALQNTFSVAYPNVTLSLNISSQLVQSFDEIHFCSTLQELAQCVQSITQGHFIGPNYGGVNITAQNGTIFVWDDTFTPQTVQINFTDFVGQPTWIAVNTMILKLVLRGDLQLGMQVKMPQLAFAGQAGPSLATAGPGLVTSTNQSFPSSNKYRIAFQGTFTISELRHIGSYRSPDGASWTTLAKCLTPDAS
jgi:hypothetical protein